MKSLDIPHYSSYTDSIVAFVDVLGFDKNAREISSDTDFYRIAKLLFSFRETSKGLNQDKSLFMNFRMTTMSDSIVVSMPYNDPICTIALIGFLHQTQYELLATDHRRLLRGYLLRGYVYHDNNIIFGEGFSKAYELEHKIGHAPRIVIDPEVIKDARAKIAAYKGSENVVHIFNYLMQDTSDGLYFIDYLKPVGSQSRLSCEVREKERNSIGTFIQSCLKEFSCNLKVYRKYRWLAAYYKQAQNISSDGSGEIPDPQS
jgi:hypothetical protein